MDGRVVELDALADADRAGSQHEDLLPVGRNRFVLLFVAGIEIRDVGRVLAGAAVDDLVDGQDRFVQAQAGDVLGAALPQAADLLVAESQALGLPEVIQLARVGGEDRLVADDPQEGLQEEHVDLRPVVDQGDVDAEAHQLRDGEDPVVGPLGDIGEELVGAAGVELLLVDVADADLQGADRFEEALLEGAADAHHLAGRLHLRAELVRGFAELVEREAGEFRDDVVQRGLEGGGMAVQEDLVERQADGDLRGHAGDREAAGLRGEGRGAGDAGVDLDDVVGEGERVEGELDVAAAFDLQGADHLEGAVAQELVLLVRQGLARGDDDRVAGVDADRVDVLHRADGDGGVVGVAHDLELDFLVALDALFDEDLVDRGQGEGVAHVVAQFLLVVGKAAAGAAEGEGRTEDDRVADLLGDADRLFDAVDRLGGDDGLAEAEAELLEELAVLGLLDALEGGSEDFDVALVEDAFLGQLDGEVQAGLAAEARDEGVRTLVADDLGDVFQFERFHIDLVGHMGVGHDRRRIGVHEDDLIALFLEGDAGLGACIVEFGGLSDHDRAGADDHHFLDICPARHNLLAH